MAGVKPTVEQKDADGHEIPASPPPAEDGEPKADGESKADGDTIAELGDAVGGPA